MSRCIRIKDSNAVYHIMVRGISEGVLFREDTDKEMFLEVLNNIKAIYGFKVYSYLMLKNEAHFVIAANGSDVSEFMKRINGSYCLRYNSKYKRFGRLFHDRFKSRILEDDNTIFETNASINYAANEAKEYKYSSIGIYVGLIKDEFKLLDLDYIENHLKNMSAVSDKYSDYLLSRDIERVRELLEFRNQKGTSYGKTIEDPACEVKREAQ